MQLYTHKRQLAHTQAHSNGGAGGVLHHRRASRVLRLSKCCCAGSSHTPRKATAVSLSSTSSAAVASIFDLEKSLIARLSTIFQVLFWKKVPSVLFFDL